MGKFIEMAQAYEMSSKKVDELKKQIDLTNEQIEILYAIASSRSMYNYDTESIISDHIRSIKVNAIKKTLNLFEFKGEFYDIENLLLAICTNKIYKDFSFCNDTFLYSDLYIGETADVDIARQRTRFIIVEDHSVFRLYEDITRLGYEKCNIREVEKDFKEIAEFMKSKKSVMNKLMANKVSVEQQNTKKHIEQEERYR